MATKKVKLNDKKYISDEAKEVRTFAVILIVIIVIVLGIYGITSVLKGKEDDNKTRDVTPGAIDYDIVSVGTMLNRPASEYYVIIYDSTVSDAVQYSSIVNKYMSKENAKPIYFCDLNNKLNSKYYVGKDGISNPNAKKISDLALKDLTFIKVKDGKIDKYIENLDTIKDELGL